VVEIRVWPGKPASSEGLSPTFGWVRLAFGGEKGGVKEDILGTEEKLKKLENVSEYVFQEWGVTFHPPYKNFVLEISVRGR